MRLSAPSRVGHRRDWIWRAIVAVAVVMTTALAAHAFDTSWIQDGQPVSATNLKANLDEAQTRLGAVESGDLTIAGNKTFTGRSTFGNKVVITDAGALGIGTDPTNKLDIVGQTAPSGGMLPGRIVISDDGSFHPYVELAKSTGIGNNYYQAAISGSVTSNSSIDFMTGTASGGPIGADQQIVRMTITQSGQVGIGTFNPGTTLDVQPPGSSATVGLRVGATCVAGTCPSDKKLKHDIRYLSGSLALVNQLKPASYRYKDFNEVGYGLVAQDVQRVAPNLVQRHANGFLEVNYSPLTMMLVDSVQDLSRRIESPNASSSEVARLRRENAELRARVDRLEATMQKLAAGPLSRRQLP